MSEGAGGQIGGEAGGKTGGEAGGYFGRQVGSGQAAGESIGNASGQSAPFLSTDYPPDDAVAVMIAAAVTGLACTSSGGAIIGDPEGVSREDTPWKFSGRWWAAPLVLRRSRPIR